jgi:hypothetical protein
MSTPMPPGPDATEPEPAAPPAPAGPRRGRRALLGLLLLGLTGVLGLPLGLLWSAVAPHLPVEMSADGPVLTSGEPEQFIADEGWYLLLTAAFGILVAVLAWSVLRRYRGVAMLVGVVLGAAVAGVLAWKTGSLLGRSHYVYLKAHAPEGTRFLKPVDLRLGGGVLLGGLKVPADTMVAALAATLTYLLFTGFAFDPDLRPLRDIPPAAIHPAPDPTSGAAAWGPAAPGGSGSGASDWGVPAWGPRAPGASGQGVGGDGGAGGDGGSGSDGGSRPSEGPAGHPASGGTVSGGTGADGEPGARYRAADAEPSTGA